MYRAPYPSLEEIKQRPAFPSSIWQLEPHRSGMASVAESRGGPFDISWEIHGEGPVKVAFICGLGFTKVSYQRQTLHFGHHQGAKHSVLILDNRGTGASSTPYHRYSTSEMARDIAEVLEQIGWTDTSASAKPPQSQNVHVVGISMGGMIAQEFAYLFPSRVASLSLLSTAPRIEREASTGWWQNVLNRAEMLLPKSPDGAVQSMIAKVFGAGYADQADDSPLPVIGQTPMCRPPLSIPEAHALLPASVQGASDERRTSGEEEEEEEARQYQRFGTNYERFAAMEIYKMAYFSRAGFLLQLVAAGWHHKTNAQLREIGRRVGTARILVVHGDQDAVIPVALGRALAEGLGVEENCHVVRGMGHAPVMERSGWLHGVLEAIFEAGERESGRFGAG